MERARRIGLSLACLGGALLLHKGFCEWRTLEYAVADRAAHEALLLLTIRSVPHPDGNAERWDLEDAALRAYDRTWLACHHELHDEPRADEDRARCFAARSYSVIGTTAEAVALAECEIERHGRLQQPEALARCLLARGYPEHPVPRWAFERIGRRFEEPYLTRTALFAEDRLGTPGASRLVALALGVVLPFLLGALALHAVLRGARA